MKEWMARIMGIQPRLLPTSILLLLSAGASLWIVLLPDTRSIPTWGTYPVFVMAFGSLLLLIWSLIIHAKGHPIKNLMRHLSEESALLTKFFNDYSFRTITGAYGSLFFNSLLAVSKGWTGVVSSSSWFVILASYYLAVAVVRFLLLKSSRKLKKITEPTMHSSYQWKTYRLSGIFLLVITLLLQLTVVHIVIAGSGHIYEGVLIYAVAFYDFYFLSKEIVHLIKARKTKDPILKAIKAVSFMTAMVAMLSLQTAMFASFGVETERSFQQLMNALSGTVTCLIGLFMGIRMIITSKKQLLLLAENQAE